jgi:hypothetical protein
MQPISVQVIAYAPTIFRHCQHCEVAFEGLGFGERIHREEAADALPDDLITDFARVSDWVHGLIERHGPRVAVSVVDAASIEGFWKSLRHRARRYPAVVVDGRTTDLDGAGELIDQRLAAAPGPVGSRGEKGAD